jgi:hypothetical protein
VRPYRKGVVPSSHLTEDGRCIVTTPGAGSSVDEVFYVLGSGTTFAIQPADWIDPAARQSARLPAEPLRTEHGRGRGGAARGARRRTGRGGVTVAEKR